MFELMYNKTREWNPGSCFIVFYLLSISLISFLFFYRVYTESFIGMLESFTIKEDLSLLIDALFFAPWFETLLYNSFLTIVFAKFKVRPPNIILCVAIIFSVSHYVNGILAPVMLFLPALAFSWNYYLYYEKRNYIYGFLSTSILHFMYNFTMFVIIPMIYVVIDIYYGIDLLK